MLRRGGHWKLKEETLGLTLWRTRFGRFYGPFVRQIALECWLGNESIGTVAYYGSELWTVTEETVKAIGVECVKN